LFTCLPARRGRSPLDRRDRGVFCRGHSSLYGSGRNALVISPETVRLTRTPDPRPEDSVLVETRTFKLAEFGPSQVEEVSDTNGYIDANYRAAYGGEVTPKIHEDLERYVKNAYLAKKLSKLEHGDSTDFDHGFNLTLVADGAMRGDSSLIDAAVAIFPSSTANSMPKWFSTTPPVPGPDMSAMQNTSWSLPRTAVQRLSHLALTSMSSERGFWFPSGLPCAHCRGQDNPIGNGDLDRELQRGRTGCCDRDIPV